MGATPVRRAAKGSRLTAAEYDSNMDSIDQDAPVTLTISSGAITVTGPGTYHVLPESGAADDLTTINGALGREWRIVICTQTTGHQITVVRGTNLRMATASFLLDGLDDSITFQDRAASIWREVGRVSASA